MKKIAIWGVLISLCFSHYALADAAADLKLRLNKINSFHASFSQKVTDGSGALVQQGQGELWVKRPDLFNWHITKPDESLLISDGKTLWFYSPFVEQVSALWLKDATSDTPFMLIARNQNSDWQQYNVSRQGNNFTLTPKKDSNLKQFTVEVDAGGIIHRFSTLERDGQRSSYQLTSVQNAPILADKFTFTPPEGVTLDDQRQ